MSNTSHKYDYTDPATGNVFTVVLTKSEWDNIWTRAYKKAQVNVGTMLAGVRFNLGNTTLSSIHKDLLDAYAKKKLSAAGTLTSTSLGTAHPKSQTQTAADAKDPLAQLTLVRQGCAWNLPPHIWSNSTRVSLPGSEPKERRGRIYHYYTSPQQTNVTVPKLQAAAKANALGTQGYKFNSAAGYPDDASRRYGFQFIWNPQTYSVQTALQQDMTPSTGDAFVAGQAMFPGTANVQFTVLVDRTNDFASLKKAPKTWANYTDYLGTYYKTKTAYPDGADLSEKTRVDGKHKLDWLMSQGTMADIEYLYRAINDVRIVSKPLKGGFISADVGYLGFSLLAVELGNTHYIGYITGLSINHTLFTEDYIPIRSEVSISMNLMAQAGTTSAVVKVGKVK